MKGKVLVGMSGGVDSSVAALLLQKSGWEVVGCTLRLHLDDPSFPPREGGCCSFQDVQDARRVCYSLGIDHFVFNFTELFEQKVIDNFVSEYAVGRTPNPCIRCNRWLKFGAMLRRAEELGCDAIATGHYAKVQQGPDGRWQLYASPYGKDQSYVLYSLTQKQLAHTLLPLAALPKPKVRSIAQEAGLPVAQKPDSQEICFVPDKDYAGFLCRHNGHDSTPGDFVDAKGHVLGRHRGLTHYTVGQRKGLGIAFGQPMYVTRLDTAQNQVVLGPEGSQYSRSLLADDLNWVSIPAPETPLQVQAKIRYQAKPASALASIQPDGTLLLHFAEPQRAVAPGQAVVLYDGDLLLGGGTIVKGIKE
ncbi:MAG: tRNA 2-thiouridine(34) synthase MnmA [Oscillospiraceae bacterium]|nr:tRNA 2-thiouridine(34) synthase MnmA [Oscillospiraceae bacterium]HCA72235.1 tRNA 2-thiouridine(34) synthase MnmA [Oscillospiraceae bacterium]